MERKGEIKQVAIGAYVCVSVATPLLLCVVES